MIKDIQKRAGQRKSAVIIGIAVACTAFVLTGITALAQDPGDKAKTTQEEPAVRSTHPVPKSNETKLGLYATPKEAYEMWKTDPEGVHILDVRTFEEYIFVGHFKAAKNVPLLFPKFDPKGPSMPGRPPGCSGEFNPDFVAQVKEAIGPDATILVMCSSGARAAVGINQLAKAGFTQVYNIINGFEGDVVDDPGSVYHGKHMRNGWKNCGLPWTYSFDPDLMWVAPKE